MKREIILVLSLALVALSVSITLPFSSAVFVDPHGLMLSQYPQEPMVFWANGDISISFIMFSEPPWYYNLGEWGAFTFDTVTMALTLTPTGLTGQGTTPLCFTEGHTDIHGSCVYTATWSNWSMSEDEYGAVHDSYLITTVTFHIDQNTATGFYRLVMTGEATANGVLFQGWDQAGVSVRPPGYGILFGDVGD